MIYCICKFTLNTLNRKEVSILKYNEIDMGKRIEALVNEYCKENSCSKEYFCESVLYVSRGTLYKWFRGKAMPENKYLKDMCVLFDCDMGYLLCEPEYTDKRSRRNTDIYNVTGLSDRAIQNIKKMRGRKNLFGEKNNRLNLLLENKDIIPLIEDIEHYVRLKNQKNPDENALNAEAYSLYRKFMDMLDNSKISDK